MRPSINAAGRPSRVRAPLGSSSYTLPPHDLGNIAEPGARRVGDPVLVARLVARGPGRHLRAHVCALESIPKSDAFRNRVVDALERGDLGKATALCEMSQLPLADVFERGLTVAQKTPEKTTEAVTSQRNATVLTLKRYLWALGTVGSSAPFVGLFGTVVGILKAFQSIAVAGAGGFKVVSQGIAAALVATAAGLLVAIYAVIAYNYFVARINSIAMQYRLYTEDFLTALGRRLKVRPTPAARPDAQHNADGRVGSPRRNADDGNERSARRRLSEGRRGRGERDGRRGDQHHPADRRLPRVAHHLHGDLDRAGRVRGRLARGNEGRPSQGQRGRPGVAATQRSGPHGHQGRRALPRLAQDRVRRIWRRRSGRR